MNAMLSTTAAARSDLELLAGWRAGDVGAGAELFARHFAQVYGFFASKLGYAAEDLTQEVFLRCVEARDDFRGASSFRTYLFVIARNALFSHVARKGNRPTDPDFEITSIEALDDSPSAVLACHDDHKLLIHGLRRLPLELQVALELYYVQGLRGSELVEVLGLPSGTVRSRIRRALEQLRANMAMLSSASLPLHTTLTDLRRWAEAVRASL